MSFANGSGDGSGGPSTPDPWKILVYFAATAGVGSGFVIAALLQTGCPV